jgi:Phage derived protein Gp49-like (DUF891)
MASGWTVETLDHRVDREIEALPPDIRAGLTRISLLIEEIGLERMREPYVKHIDGPIWEMRPPARADEIRRNDENRPASSEVAEGSGIQGCL